MNLENNRYTSAVACLQVADYLYKGVYYRHACVKCHESIENVLKSVIEYKGQKVK